VLFAYEMAHTIPQTQKKKKIGGDHHIRGEKKAKRTAKELQVTFQLVTFFYFMEFYASNSVMRYE
jgi:hypothetical protein